MVGEPHHKSDIVVIILVSNSYIEDAHLMYKRDDTKSSDCIKESNHYLNILTLQIEHDFRLPLCHRRLPCILISL